MLVDLPTQQLTDDLLQMIAALTGQSDAVLGLQKGIYQVSHFGSSSLLRGWEHYPEFPDIDTDEGAQYRAGRGVCDNVKQLLAHYPELENSERQFVVTLTSIHRESQPSDGGWRWHKWGAYIGTQKPEHEYIYDDKHIDLVYVFHIYEFKP